jgi:hypothetical protein
VETGCQGGQGSPRAVAPSEEEEEERIMTALRKRSMQWNYNSDRIRERIKADPPALLTPSKKSHEIPQ